MESFSEFGLWARERITFVNVDVPGGVAGAGHSFTSYRNNECCFTLRKTLLFTFPRISQ
jgi:hypothetical protein